VAPDLLAGVDPAELARLAAAALTPTPPPQVATAHIAPPKLSVSEAVARLARRLSHRGPTSFQDLVGDGTPIEVVLGFLAVLELYKRALVDLEQAAVFGDIAVRWTGEGEPDLADLADLLAEEPA
jgi:segregation and condensation protein A